MKIPTYPGLVEDHEELVAEGLVDRVRLPLLVAEEGLQQVGKLVYVDGAVAGMEYKDMKINLAYFQYLLHIIKQG